MAQSKYSEFGPLDGFFHASNRDAHFQMRYKYPLAGKMAAATYANSQMSICSDSRLPVLIYSDIGPEQLSLCAQDDYQRDAGQFIVIPSSLESAEAYQQCLREGVSRATSGTLYLSEIDRLSEAQKLCLIEVIQVDKLMEKLAEHDIQLIVSCTERVDTLSKSTTYFELIMRLLKPCLEVSLPSVQGFQPDAFSHIPSFLNQSHDLREDQPFDERGDIPPDIIEMILDEQTTVFSKYHPGLQKALSFLKDNFTQDIHLDDIAKSSFTSPSHLSYLFRRYIGQSFKKLLVQIRIHYAKTLIDEKPMCKITEVSLSAGFGDLSHFEKMFKRYVGCTPRQYRFQQRKLQCIARR
ncbi:AraC family transcriptional regulator [Photobacterium sp. 1_MG-2023]|uniref:helix-turn-helix transcriptional regulator n=1 Tax=Photobacterium sp. 1_MG-2023 TaxID=3062646 RepID=UPI0026E118CD|nr:AraC family transcriptional regulator [Photobacterium sp. 1_MG-2023]MDO6708358.1 AraC family transcriptional regulator [Photobacterium sp. 1_MG-2023]